MTPLFGNIDILKGSLLHPVIQALYNKCSCTFLAIILVDVKQQFENGKTSVQTFIIQLSVSLARHQLANPTEIPAEAKATPVFISVSVCLSVCNTRIAYQNSKLIFSTSTALILIEFEN